MTSLCDNTRPSDPVLCSTWLDAYGASKYVECNHPFRAGEVLSGSIVIPGARKLRIVLHPMCSTPDAVRITFTVDSSTGGAAPATFGPFSGPVDTSASHTPWSAAKTITVNEFAGDRVTYSFVVPVGDNNADALWGVGFTVTAVSLGTKEKEAIVAKNAAVIGHCVRPLVTTWTHGMDAELCELARRICDNGTSIGRLV